jgi:hypothetical protein
MPIVVMLSVFMLSVVMLSVVMLSVVMFSVVAPKRQGISNKNPPLRGVNGFGGKAQIKQPEYNLFSLRNCYSKI